MSKNDEKNIIELEERFWKSMVDRETQAALDLLADPAVMVSSKGAMKFDHAGYSAMAEDGAYKLLDFRLDKTQVVFPANDVAVLTYEVDQTTEMKGKRMDAKMSDSSTWVRKGDRWLCVIHTESPMDASS